MTNIITIDFAKTKVLYYGFDLEGNQLPSIFSFEANFGLEPMFMGFREMDNEQTFFIKKSILDKMIESAIPITNIEKENNVVKFPGKNPEK
jgi:hypothetical protein